MKNVIVTGGLGFIGFNAVQLWKKIRPDLNIVVVDCETYAAYFKLAKKKKWLKDNKVEYVYVDIFRPVFNGNNMIEHIIKYFNIDTIVNFAAESHVDNSIKSPWIFYETNIIGTTNLLDIARKYGIRYHQVSTDEVYGETFPDGSTDKTDVNLLKPSSPYSSSKASADLIVLSYCRTFGTNATVSRCTNNFGPWQHPEKLIPTICKKLFADEKIPIYGNGLQHRQWIHVDDHNEALLKIIENGKAGEVYNISQEHAGYMANIELVKHLIGEGKKLEDYVQFVTDRPGHDISYFIYNYFPVARSHETIEAVSSKIKAQLLETKQWYFENL